MIQLFGFSILAYKNTIEKSVTGVSLKTLECYSLVFLFRFLSVIFYSGYLPLDKSGDWFYQFCEVLSFVVVLYNIYLILFPLKYTHNIHCDNYGHFTKYIPNRMCHYVVLVLPALILAIVYIKEFFFHIFFFSFLFILFFSYLF